VIRAAESADIAALLDLAETTIFRCADAGRTAPSECADQPDAKLPVVTHWVGAGRPTPRPVTWMDRRLHELFDDNAPVLVFAARELAPPDEGGGRYFLVFVAPELRDPESRYDRIGLIVRPHPDHPIEAIAFGVPGSSPVAWGASIAPQSEVVLATVPVGP
jgi:hypothetical protein